ncbi:uncharacterized protein A4U43_C05F13610, partial [Asparagus officinalis]
SFKQDSCPNEGQRQILSDKLGVDPLQINFWFQNKRNQQKVLAEYQFPSPLVPTRECVFLRFCKKMSDRCWAIVDFSLDSTDPCDARKCLRKPSGCIIEILSFEYLKVIWIENVEVDNSFVHNSRIIKELDVDTSVDDDDANPFYMINVQGGYPLVKDLNAKKIDQIVVGKETEDTVSLLCLRDMTFKEISNKVIIILQESSFDVASSYAVFAPVMEKDMNQLMNGTDSGEVHLLPSGFAIAADGPSLNRGSLVTVSFQIIMDS